MVMKVMPLCESLEGADAFEGVAMLVFPVVQEGEVVVASVEPEQYEGGDSGGEHEPDECPDRPCGAHDQKERRADQRAGFRVTRLD